MKVRIGIDARRYDTSGRGQERYVRSLVHALATTDTDHEFLLISDRITPGGTDLGPRTRPVSPTTRIRLQHRRRLVGLRRFLVRDLDLVHFPLADGWYSRVCPTVVTIHDLSVLRFPEAYFDDVEAGRTAWRHHRAITETADAVIAVSEATARDVVHLLDVPEDRVAVVPHGVDPRFRPVDPRVVDEVRRRHGLPSEYLLFVGGMDFKKNVARLVAGYALARRSGRLPHVLALAGPLQQEGNPFFDAAREQAQTMGVTGHVVWLGYVPEEDLPALYGGARALVFPSIMEGFGLPVLEAAACGASVVTSDGSAMGEVAGDAAVFVDPWDPPSIADGILQALGRERTPAEASARRAAAYTWERTAARTIEVYERVAAGRPLREGVRA
jgi:glycosyltransferase involved in cell wall biosynthesis